MPHTLVDTNWGSSGQTTRGGTQQHMQCARVRTTQVPTRAGATRRFGFKGLCCESTTSFPLQAAGYEACLTCMRAACCAQVAVALATSVCFFKCASVTTCKCEVHCLTATKQQLQMQQSFLLRSTHETHTDKTTALSTGQAHPPQPNTPPSLHRLVTTTATSFLDS